MCGSQKFSLRIISLRIFQEYKFSKRFPLHKKTVFFELFCFDIGLETPEFVIGYNWPQRGRSGSLLSFLWYSNRLHGVVVPLLKLFEKIIWRGRLIAQPETPCGLAFCGPQKEQRPAASNNRPSKHRRKRWNFEARPSPWRYYGVSQNTSQWFV